MNHASKCLWCADAILGAAIFSSISTAWGDVGGGGIGNFMPYSLPETVVIDGKLDILRMSWKPKAGQTVKLNLKVERFSI